MTYELNYHDLIIVHSKDPSSLGIYWLRLFRENQRHLAIVTEVPLNPGPWLPEIERDIRDHIRSLAAELLPQQDINLANLYWVLPRGYPRPEAPVIRDVQRRHDWHKQQEDRKGVRRNNDTSSVTDDGSISRDELQASLGFQLPDLPVNHELRMRVMKIREQKIEREGIEVFAVQQHDWQYEGDG